MHQNRAEQGALVTERRRLVEGLLGPLDVALTPWIAHGLLLAVSGGPDSRALLELCARWQKRGRGPIHVATVDHGTTRSAYTAARAVFDRAEALGFPTEILTMTLVREDESTLRSARYEMLSDAARHHELGAIVTAHTANDDAEGVLLDVLGRGGGRQGAGMAAERLLSVTSTTRVLRPFLRTPKVQLGLALTGLGIFDAVVDPADVRGGGARADLRRGALDFRGLLTETPRLSRKARLRREDEDALQRLAAAIVAGATVGSDGARQIDVTGQPRAVARRALELLLGDVAPGADFRRSAPMLDRALDALDPNAMATVPVSVDVAGARLTVHGTYAQASPGTVPALAGVRFGTHDGTP